MEVFMGRPARWTQKLTGRGAMRSPLGRGRRPESGSRCGARARSTSRRKASDRRRHPELRAMRRR
jgi:hypothetical protein